MRRALLLIPTVLLVVAAACGGSSSETPWPVEPDPAQLGPSQENAPPSMITGGRDGGVLGSPRRGSNWP